MLFETRQIWTSSHLPALSRLGTHVLALSREPETSSVELLKLLRTDTHLEHRILAVANSTWFGPQTGTAPSVETLEQALAALGTSDMTSLALALVVRETCLCPGMPLPHITRFWKQAVVKAVAAETLCEQVQEGLKGEYLLAGLLLDVGRITLLGTATESYLGVLEKARQELLPLWRVEQSELGATAAQIGAQLVEQWGFPSRLVGGIQAQCAPLITFKQMAATTEDPLCSALALASAIGDYYCGEQQALAWFRIRELTSEILPMSEAELNSLLQRVELRFTAVARELTVGDATLPDLQSLQSRAVQQLNSLQTSAPPESTPRKSAVLSSGEVTARRACSAGGAEGHQENIRDPLTHLFTAEFFLKSLQKEVERCRPLALPVGVAFVRIDRWDDLAPQGAEFGEAALKKIGSVLKELLRSSDTVARIDHQFGILACDPTAKGMQRLADRIRGRVASESLEWAGKQIPLTVSVGATLALPERGDETIGEKVLTAAQRAAMEAGTGEGNNVYFDSLVTEIELQRLFMSNQFRFSRWLISKGVLDIPRVGKALLEFKQQPLRLGDLALRQELLHERDVEEILLDQEASQCRFGDVAVRRELLTEDQLVGLLILQQEDPLRVAELFLRLAILDEQRLRPLLKEYFSVVPWAAPLYPPAANN